MVDRKPTYKNRVLVTKEADGTQEYVTWEHADSPITEGTPLNKQNLMSDEAAAAVGLAADATPSKAFEVIGASLRGQNADVDKLQTDVGKLQTDVGKLQTAVKRIRYVDVWLPTSGWSDSAPYTLTASEPDVTEDWVPGIPALLHDSDIDIPWLLRSIEALECIKMITSAAGTLTFTAPEDKPSTAITLRVPGMFR